MKTSPKHDKIHQLLKEYNGTLTYSEIAKRHGVSTTTVFRASKRLRAEGFDLKFPVNHGSSKKEPVAKTSDIKRLLGW